MGAYEKSRAVAVGENYYASLFCQSLNKLTLFPVLENSETVGGYYKPVDKGGQLDFVVFPSTMTASLSFIIPFFPSKFQTA